MDYNVDLDSTYNVLRNMETTLGYGYNPNVPSMANGYCMPAIQDTSKSFNWYNPTFGSATDSIYNAQTGTGSSTGATMGQPNFAGLNNVDWSALANYYAENISPSQSILGAAASGAGFAVVNNPRLIFHPINTIKSLKETNSMFANCKKSGTKLYELWHAKETNGIMQDAYAAFNKLEARNYRKIGMFRKRYSQADYNTLKKIMQEALNSGNAEKIAEATAKLKNAYINDGWFFKGVNWVKGLFTKSEMPTVEGKLKDTASINKLSGELMQTSKGLKFGEALKRGGGVKGGIFFAAIDILMNKDKIAIAFAQDKEDKQKTGENHHYGIQQLGQTVIKAGINALGWAAGDAAAVCLMAKAGAAIGTAFGPGVGTVIGAIAGVVGGSIGMCITGALTNWIFGKDVADGIKAVKNTKTPEGQKELISFAAENIGKDKNMSQDVCNAVFKAQSAYAV